MYRVKELGGEDHGGCNYRLRGVNIYHFGTVN